MCKKCSYPEGMEMRIGDIPIDPCIYEPIEMYGNVIITISRCVNCGHQEISWRRQEDTIDLTEMLEKED